MSVTHKFVSAIPDSTDTTIVRPSNWNDGHTVNVDLTSEVQGILPVANGGTGSGTGTLAAANSVFGNNTGSPAAPSFQTSIAISGTMASGADTITSTSVNALAVGANGTTNPVLRVGANAASVNTGISISGAASGGTTNILATGTNPNLLIGMNGGTGSLTFDGPSGASNSIIFSMNGTTAMKINNSAVQTQFQANRNDVNNPALTHFLYTNPVDVLMTASTEVIPINWNINVTRQHNTGALTLQRDFLIQGASDSFVGASTLTDGATFAATYKSAGTNATVTNSSAIYVATQALSGTVTNAYGINISAPTGAGTNYAARLNGAIINPTFTTPGVLVNDSSGNITSSTLTPFLLSTTTGIDGKAVANTALYTVPGGKTAIITAATIRCSAATAITVGASAGIGNISGTSNIFSSTAMTTFTTTTQCFQFAAVGVSVITAATGQIFLNIGTGATGTSQTLSVDLLGYLI